MVQMQISLVGRLILAIPFITVELWGFVAPGLTAEEKKGFHLVSIRCVTRNQSRSGSLVFSKIVPAITENR
jgi:hypothetical protein